MGRRDCPLCGGTALEEFLHQPSVPTNVIVLFDDPDEARAWPRGSLRLVACADCGLIFNADVEPRLIEYSARIEETQAFSPHFTAYAEALAADWIDRFDLRGRRILEVGCGKGEFLATLCRLGAGSGIGFDPAARADRISPDAAARIELVVDRFDDRHLDVEADALVCRHTLEHVPEVVRFLGLLRRWAARRARPPVLLFEVPDVARVLRETAFWDVYYEHCSYFTRDSLRRAFACAGFEVRGERAVYDDQYLILEAAPGVAPARPGRQPYAGEVLGAAARFGRSFRQAARRAGSHLARLRRDGPVVVWGGGAKGCAFLTALELGELVAAVVDVNPHKQGRFLIGTGHPVVGPEDLRGLRPAHVVVMNPVYLDEIAATLKGVGVEATLHGANDVLAPCVADGTGAPASLNHGSTGA
jgi:SAM-dependent methyltransferase